MKLDSLRLVNWRNYHENELVFSPGINVICGDNAQGKTNLIEAVSYLGLASSFRGADDSDLILHGADYFFLAARIERERYGSAEINAAMDRRRHRKWSVNGEAKKRLADIIGICHSVVFSPDDIDLVKGGPDRRRRWLNRQLSQNDAVYCRDMLDYNRVLHQRNALLRNWAKNPDEDSLRIWDQQLAEYGAKVALGRSRAIEALIPIAVEIHASLSGGEKLAMEHSCKILPKDGKGDIEEIKENFRRELAAHAVAEQTRGITLVGPHRDELKLFINGDAARDFASQGQQRTLAVSLKLAELELARQMKGEYPILLLDDVLSELDDTRRRRILELPGKTQTFITAAGKDLPAIDGKKLLISRDAEGYAQVKEI